MDLREVLTTISAAMQKKARMEAGIPAEERAQEQHQLAMDVGRSNLADKEEMGPVNRAVKMAQTKQYLANALRLEGANEKEIEIAMAKIEAASELNPQKRALLEAQAVQSGASAHLSQQRADNPELFRSAGGAGGRPKLQQMRTVDENGNPVTRYVTPGLGDEYPAAPTATQRDQSGIAITVGGAIQEMRTAMEEGKLQGMPVIGSASKLKQKYLPSGDEGIFDYNSRQLPMIVYLTSGKQINANEMRMLENLVPDRAKGNLDFQMKRFERFAYNLLKKYNVHEDWMDRFASPTTPARPATRPSATTPAAPAPSGNIDDVLSGLGL